MSAEEISKEISLVVKSRKKNLTKALRRHKINPTTFYDWYAGKKSPSDSNREKLLALYSSYSMQKNLI